MKLDVPDIWVWLQALPFWAIFAIIAAIAVLILVSELFINLWDRRRIKSCQRWWVEYHQRVSAYREHYKDAHRLKWKEVLQSQPDP
jgi:peptidoglycan/LPS O-acetylase OafA/YrhL